MRTDIIREDTVAAAYQALEAKLAEAQALLDSLGDWQPATLPMALMTDDGIRMEVLDHWDAETCPVMEVANGKVLLNQTRIKWAHTITEEEITR